LFFWFVALVLEIPMVVRFFSSFFLLGVDFGIGDCTGLLASVLSVADGFVSSSDSSISLIHDFYNRTLQ
jgi:hypothetical protein